MYHLVIGSVNLSAHENYEVIVQDLDGEGTGRSETGTLTRQRIAVKHTVKGTYRVKTSDLDNIAAALSPASITVTFFNPYVTGMSTTATMYAGNRSASIVKHKNDDEANAYWDLSFDLIEY